MTKIDIFSGFLGAGKTTLIKKLLQEAFSGEQVVLIENEFGEIGIDGGFLKEAGIEIREMNSGCICCSLVGDFGTALREVISTYHPDRILIEPSGVGKLSDVIKAVEQVTGEPDVVLNSTVTVVDASKCKMYMRNFGEFFNNQIQYAGTIVLSRTDKVGEEKAVQSVELLRQVNETSPVVTTPISMLEGKKLLEVIEGVKPLAQDMMEEKVCPVCGGHHHDHDEKCGSHEDEHHHEHGADCGSHEHAYHHHDHDEDCSGHGHEHHDHGENCGCHGHEHHDHDEECRSHEHEHHHHDHGGDCGCHAHDHHHHHADEVFTSWGRETVKSYTKEEIEAILHTLSDSRDYGMVLRAKGMVAGKDGQWIYFDMVPGEADIRNGAADYTGRLCVIGSKLQEEELERLFGLK